MSKKVINPIKQNVIYSLWICKIGFEKLQKNQNQNTKIKQNINTNIQKIKIQSHIKQT